MARSRSMTSLLSAVALVAGSCSLLSAGSAFHVPLRMQASPSNLVAAGDAVLGEPLDIRVHGNTAAAPALLCSASGALLGACAMVAIASATVARSRAGKHGTALRYTTQKILQSMTWLKTGFSSKDVAAGELRVTCLAGVDVCVGKTAGGKLFAIGDKAPPTGISFSAGAQVQGDALFEPQYGNSFNVFTGLPEGDWCPSPPVIGAAIGNLTGGPEAVLTFEVREAFLSGAVEVLVDTNAKRAFEADYWKGLLDAQGKDDGSYY